MSRLILAPMEGLADDVLREVLTRPGAYDWCVTEFVRVTTAVLPHSAYTRVSPELKQGAQTSSGTPVRVQLLGSDPAMLAANAAHLAKLNPFGIDLNFGCPAPLVNRHRGGAALLEEPELLHRIASAVRRAVPPPIAVTAKMRLGINDTAFALACAQALEAAGVQEVVVHGRTKQDGYRPQVRWEWIARVRDTLHIPVIANGEVWTLDEYRAIRDESGCEDVMLGRGAVADPLLASRIRQGEVASPARLAADWTQILILIGEFWARVQGKLAARHAPGRLKQWVGQMRRNYVEAERLYAAIRELRNVAEVDLALRLHGVQLLPIRPYRSADAID